MFYLPLIALCTTLLPLVTAAGCWRDSNCSYGPQNASFSGSWDKYNLSPQSRVVRPVSSTIDFKTITPFPGSNKPSLSGNGSTLIFDFGKEVGGIIRVSYSAQGSGSLGLAFSEARNWTGQSSDHSSSFNGADGALYTNITSTSSAVYTVPDDKLRGGFRYLTLFTTTSSSINVSLADITLELSFAPTWADLRAYGGYFYSSDDLLNRIWYAGAYTLQTTSIPAKTGRRFPVVSSGWENDADLHPGAIDPTIYVDGAKRDRIVWAGDLTVAGPSILYSLGDWNGLRYTLDSLYDGQASNGGLPFAGAAAFIYDSDTYHLATMLGTHDYLLWTNDGPWLRYVYSKYKAAMNFIIGKMDNTGLLKVTGNNDWGRLTQGGHNTEANMLLYRALTTGASIASWANDTDSASQWSSRATNLKAAINQQLWDSNTRTYKDSDTNTSLHPEDANSMGLLYGVAASNDSVQSVSKYLTTTWGPLGAVCPELPGNVVTFVESFEIKAHFVARQASRAMDLIRRSWGWYINNPFGTQSTFIEGYLADGTFGYRASAPGGYQGDYSFVSHSHGWSTGPVSALTTYVVGLALTAPAGSKWSLAPQFGGLQFAEGGLTTPLGTFSSGWNKSATNYTLWYKAPAGTQGNINAPSKQQQIVVDGVAKNATFDSNTKEISLPVQGDGKKHTIVIQL